MICGGQSGLSTCARIAYRLRFASISHESCFHTVYVQHPEVKNAIRKIEEITRVPYENYESFQVMYSVCAATDFVCYSCMISYIPFKV